MKLKLAKRKESQHVCRVSDVALTCRVSMKD